MIKICQRLVIELKIKEGQLKNVQLARQVREAIGSLAKDMETSDAQLHKYESESNVGKMKQITQKLATMAEKKKDLDKLARPSSRSSLAKAQIRPRGRISYQAASPACVFRSFGITVRLTTV
eukprot:1239483-Alexandrium_andersonii.AAC.1